MSLKELLESRKCVKLVCGAGNEDVVYVQSLVDTYAQVGVRFFDVSANLEVIRAVKDELKRQGVEGYICVSYGIKGDPHTNKAVIGSACTDCAICVDECPTGAINHLPIRVAVDVSKCIGCGKCVGECPVNAISMESRPVSIEETLPAIVAEGVDCVELHVSGVGFKEALLKWNAIQKLHKGMLSVCIDRSRYGDEALINNLESLIEDREPFTTIIQADGLPMSGTDDLPSTTLQAISIGQIVDNADLPAYLLLSGGTNSKTSEFAKAFGVSFHGVSLGSYARRVVKNNVNAVDAARRLVNTVMEYGDS